MRTAASIIEELRKVPPESLCYSYEGEITGIVICPPNDAPGCYIECGEGKELQTAPMVTAEGDQ